MTTKTINKSKCGLCAHLSSSSSCWILIWTSCSCSYSSSSCASCSCTSPRKRTPINNTHWLCGWWHTALPSAETSKEAPPGAWWALVCSTWPWLKHHGKTTLEPCTYHQIESQALSDSSPSKSASFSSAHCIELKLRDLGLMHNQMQPAPKELHLVKGRGHVQMLRWEMQGGSRWAMNKANHQHKNKQTKGLLTHAVCGAILCGRLCR